MKYLLISCFFFSLSIPAQAEIGDWIICDEQMILRNCPTFERECKDEFYLNNSNNPFVLINTIRSGRDIVKELRHKNIQLRLYYSFDPYHRLHDLDLDLDLDKTGFVSADNMISRCDWADEK